MELEDIKGYGAEDRFDGAWRRVDEQPDAGHEGRERGDDGSCSFHRDRTRALCVKHEPDGIRPQARRQDAVLRPSDPADLHAHRRIAAPIALVSLTCTPHPSHGMRERSRIAIPGVPRLWTGPARDRPMPAHRFALRSSGAAPERCEGHPAGSRPRTRGQGARVLSPHLGGRGGEEHELF